MAILEGIRQQTATVDAVVQTAEFPIDGDQPVGTVDCGVGAAAELFEIVDEPRHGDVLEIASAVRRKKTASQSTAELPSRHRRLLRECIQNQRQPSKANSIC